MSSLERALLVDEVVEQVAVLADHARRGRARRRTSRRGPRGRGRPRTGPVPGPSVRGWTATSASRKKMSGAEASRAPRLRAAAGPCGRRVADDDRPRPLGHGGRVVGRAVVDDDQLVIGQERVAKPTEAALEVAAPVSHGDHHRERRPPRLRARRTGGDIVHDSPSPVRTGHVPECVSVRGIARTRARTARRRNGAIDSPRSRRSSLLPSRAVALQSRRAAGL